MVEDRIRAALREIVAAPPVPLETRTRRWPAAALAGLAVAAIVAVVALMPVWQGRDPRPVAVGGQPTLPQTFPGYAFSQGFMDGPFGRAIAFYHNGTGHEDFGFSQLIVAGADANRLRRIDLSPAELGMQTYARLTPDGTKIIVGGSGGVISVIDLLTGSRRDYPTVATQFTAPLAVSADSRRVAYSVFGQFATEGFVNLLDLQTGEVSGALGTNALQVAFSPSGALAIQIDRTIKVVEWPGSGELWSAEVTREIQLPSSVELAGPQAWTPDGRFLVTIDTGAPSYVFQPVDPSITPVPQSIPAADLLPRAWGDSVLGWRSPTKMLVSAGDVNGTTSNLISEVDITSGGHRVISRFRAGANDDLAVGDVQLAAALLPEMGFRSGADPDRGPLPTSIIIIVLLSLAPAALIVAVVHLRRYWKRRKGESGRATPPPGPARHQPPPAAR